MRENLHNLVPPCCPIAGTGGFHYLESVSFPQISPIERLMVALDVNDWEQAKRLINELAPHVGYFKVGLELLTAVGSTVVVSHIKNSGGKIFYDGKFSDIPNTVAGAAQAAAGLGVDFFDLHANCGFASMCEAVRNRASSKVLAVTVLTSFDNAGCQEIFGASVKERVTSLARLAKKALVDGIVCSAADLEFLTADPEIASLLKVTPGIRPDWAEKNDQKRIFSPKKAIQSGADYLVVGRPILKPPSSVGSPIEAAKRVVGEIEEALR